MLPFECFAILCCSVVLISVCLFVFLKDHVTEDLFPVEEEEESSAGDLTPLVTLNTSDLLCCPQGMVHKEVYLHHICDYVALQIILDSATHFKLKGR